MGWTVRVRPVLILSRVTFYEKVILRERTLKMLLSCRLTASKLRQFVVSHWVQL